LGVPLHKINRQMKLAQAWLRRELDGKTRTRQKKPQATH
jgi:hypothetical protein